MKKTIIIILCSLFFGKIISQNKIPNKISSTEKIYGLSRFWNQVNSNFVYLNKIDKKQWEENYKRLINEVQDTKNDYEYYRLLQKFASSLKDGHTNIEFPDYVSKLLLNGEFGEYNLKTKYINGKAIIAKINASKISEIPVGTEIIEINGYPTEIYLNLKVKPYISSSTKGFLNNWAVENMFHNPKGTHFYLKLKTPKKKIIEKTFVLSKAIDQELYPNKQNKEIFEFKWLENKIAYVGLHSFGNSSIDSLFKNRLSELKTAKCLIIDLRRNLGGNSAYAHSVFKHLTNNDTIFKARSQILSYNPLYAFYGKHYNIQPKDTLQGSPENIKMLSRAYLTANDSYFYEIPFHSMINDTKKSHRIVIPTVILIGPHTASASEDFLVSADNQEHMTTIGEITAGTTGMPISFPMPKGGRARICIKKEIFPDGREFVGYGIKPDILVKNTYNDYLNNYDAVLKKAMTYLNKELEVSR